jgi:hypothetical protein
MNFNSITKQLTKDASAGAVLYVAAKGYHIADKLASKVLPVTFSGPIRSLAVAVGYTVLADQFVPKKYASFVGMAALSQAIAGFVDPYLDPMLVRQGLIDPASMTATALISSTTPPVSGYSRVNGYASVRGAGMGGYSQDGMGGLAHSNLIGL